MVLYFYVNMYNLCVRIKLTKCTLFVKHCTNILFFFFNAEDSQEMAKFIREGKEIKRKTARIMIIGFPGNGKSHLLDNLLEQKRDDYYSTGISDSVVVVDVSCEDTASTTVVTSSGSSWKKDCSSIEESLKRHVQQVKVHDKNLSQQSEESTTNHVEFNNIISQLENEVLKLEASSNYQLPQPEEPAPNNKRSELVKSSSKPASSEETQSPKETAQTKKSLEENIIDFMKQNKIMSLADLESTFSLYIRDTGGQVEFQEVFTILTNGPSIFFFVIKANLSLDEFLTFEYRKKGGEVINKYKSTTTTRQALVQTLTTIKSTMKPKNTHDSMVFIIGTHIDKLDHDCKGKKIELLNQDLYELLKSHEFTKLIEYEDKESNSVFFPVSNTKSEPEDFECIRERVSQKIKKTLIFEIPYPLRYLMFSLELRRYQGCVLYRSECDELAAKFQINSEAQIIEMLKFLHHTLGIILYYDIKGLNHLVIKEPQVLFNMLTEFMVTTFPKFHYLPSSIERDLEKGIINASNFEIITKNDGPMKEFDFIKFLEHLRIAASFYDKDAKEDKYFIPAVINRFPEINLNEVVKSNVCPLAITFKSSCCPKGVFGMTVCFFMSKEQEKNSSTFTLEKENIFRDLVCFNMHSSDDEPQGKVYLVMQKEKLSSKSYFEVRFCPDTYEKYSTLVLLCEQICSRIIEGIEHSIKKLNYDDNQVGHVKSLKCHKCEKLHKMETKDNIATVKCIKRRAPGICCSCWFDQGK